MSRFSQAEAEARGWRIFHEQPEATEVTSETQGETRTIPGSYRAEKYLSLPGQGASLITEEGETIGLLLERINAFETELEKKGATTPPPAPEVEPADGLLDEAGLPVRAVITPEGRITEAERAAGTEDARSAIEAATEVKRTAEDERVAEESPETELVVIDKTATAVDGAGAQGVFLLRKDEKFEDVGDRLAREAAERVTGAVPDAGTTSTPEGETTVAQAAEQDAAREAAIEDADRSDRGEKVEDARAAGAEAAQKESDRQIEALQQEADDLDAKIADLVAEGQVTRSAAEAAKEHGVDPATIEGTGKEGRVTKPDIEQVVEDPAQP